MRRSLFPGRPQRLGRGARIAAAVTSVGYGNKSDPGDRFLSYSYEDVLEARGMLEELGRLVRPP
jgi:hypothetical protein